MAGTAPARAARWCMLAFVICHLTAHCLLLVSFEDAEATRNVLMYPWRTWIGTGILIAAFLVHFGNALVVDLHPPFVAAEPLGIDATLRSGCAFRRC